MKYIFINDIQIISKEIHMPQKMQCFSCFECRRLFQNNNNNNILKHMASHHLHSIVTKIFVY